MKGMIALTIRAFIYIIFYVFSQFLMLRKSSS
jgi:hypothetical protein